jgi:uncharacterized repeat protein (TIGR03987 family)
MKPILIAGSIIVTSALILYSIGVFAERKQKAITKRVLLFLSLGLLFDVTATACMIIGSTNSPFTFHGFIGYTGLLAMIIETSLAYRFNIKYGSTQTVSKGLHAYTLFAYILWVVVYVTGSLLVILK